MRQKSLWRARPRPTKPRSMLDSRSPKIHLLVQQPGGICCASTSAVVSFAERHDLLRFETRKSASNLRRWKTTSRMTEDCREASMKPGLPHHGFRFELIDHPKQSMHFHTFGYSEPPEPSVTSQQRPASRLRNSEGECVGSREVHPLPSNDGGARQFRGR